MKRGRPSQHSRFIAYLVHHARVFVASLGYLSRQPVASLMTIAVIAIALALPTGLYLALHIAGDVSQDWDRSTQISLFLEKGIDEAQADTLASRLRIRKDIDSLRMVSRDQGLEQFREFSGFGDALRHLEHNPLPVVLVVQPVINPALPGQIGKLVEELQAKPAVALAQLDTQWVQRLYALLGIAERAVWVIAALLGLAVLLVVGNTIRLDIENRRAEIEVAKLIGASDAFIRRPFLYTGLWYGLCGGLLAWLLTSLSLWLLRGPAQTLAALYNSSFALRGPDSTTVTGLVILSCLLGLVGSWLAVGRHLSRIEPS